MLDCTKSRFGPHLEFTASTWSPQAAGDISHIEEVQKKALHSVSNLKGATYQKKCQEIGLETQEERRNTPGHDSNAQNIERSGQRKLQDFL